MAAKYCYYISGIGLFTDHGSDEWITDDGLYQSNEAFLIELNAQKMLAYKLKIASFEYAINSIFATQPNSPGVLRYVIDDGTVKYIDLDYASNATYFDEIQYLTSYIL